MRMFRLCIAVFIFSWEFLFLTNVQAQTPLSTPTPTPTPVPSKIRTPTGFSIVPQMQFPFGNANNKTLSIALGDVDNDLDIDIVVGNAWQQNVIYLNEPTNPFTTKRYFGAGNDFTKTVTLVDMDEDAYLDIVVGNIRQYNHVYLNNQQGKFDLAGKDIRFGEGSEDGILAVGDLDGDDHADVAVGSYNYKNTVYFGKLENGTFGFEPLGVQFGDGPKRTTALAIGDINGDRTNELIVGNLGRNEIYSCVKTVGSQSTAFSRIFNCLHVFALLDDTNYLFISSNAYPDLIVGNLKQSNQYYRNVDLNSDDFYIQESQSNFEGNYQNIAKRVVSSHDLDGDNEPDIFLEGNSDKNRIYTKSPSNTTNECVLVKAFEFPKRSNTTSMVFIKSLKTGLNSSLETGSGPFYFWIAEGNYEQQSMLYQIQYYWQ